MNVQWAVRFDQAHAGEARRLWRYNEVEVCEQDKSTWLRGAAIDDKLRATLRGFLSGQRFAVLPDGQLRSPKSLVPTGYLPDGPWIPFHDWMRVRLPRRALPGRMLQPVELRLARAEQESEAGFLLIDSAAWLRYGCVAPQVRLRRWQFAVSDDSRVMVRGEPLPSLPGRQFVDNDGLATPLGWTWSPGVDSSVVREALQLDRGDVLVFFSDELCEKIAADNWVHATREAIHNSLPI